MLHPLPQVVSELLDASGASARDRAWARFLESYSRLLLHVCHAFGGGYDAAMDRYTFILEQIQSDDLRRLRVYSASGRGKFTTWLTVVARRLCVDEHRRRYGRVQATNSEAVQDQQQRRVLVDLVAAQIDTVEVADTATLPDAHAAVAERSERLAKVLESLAPDDRILLRYRFETELPVLRIAQMIGAETPFHVYRRIDKILSALRAELERIGLREGVG